MFVVLGEGGKSGLLQPTSTYFNHRNLLLSGQPDPQQGQVPHTGGVNYVDAGEESEPSAPE